MNGHGEIDPDVLHREGCAYGQRQTVHMEYIIKEILEIKEALKDERQRNNEKSTELKNQINDLINKVDSVKEDVIKEVTKNEISRKNTTMLISAGITIAITAFKELIFFWKGGSS